jgi:hypothetical protein
MTIPDLEMAGKRPRGAAHKSARRKQRETREPLEGSPVRRTREPPEGSPVMSIPMAGKKFFGLSKNGSYDAADRGDFGRLLEVGRRKFVVIAAVEARIKAAAEAAE